MKKLILATAVAFVAVSAARLVGQAKSAGAPVPPPSSIPRMADGHPDLSGVWWKGGDVGSRALPLGGRGGATFPSLYNAAAQAKAKTLKDKDDPSLGCVSTAFGTLNVSMFDVGAVAQIVQTPKFVIVLTETYHGYQIIPFDGRPPRDTAPPSNRGEAVGKWDGDTFIVTKTNFNEDTWISAEGRVSFHSDALKITERYRRMDAKTLEVDATLEDPKVLTKPWVVDKQTLTLAPFDQILELPCGTETKGLIEAAQSGK